MKACNNMKTLFTLLNSRIHLGAHSRKMAVQGMNLVEKIPAKQAKGCKTFGNYVYG